MGSDACLPDGGGRYRHPLPHLCDAYACLPDGSGRYPQMFHPLPHLCGVDMIGDCWCILIVKVCSIIVTGGQC